MEIDKTKCLICEVSHRQKGLAFFKFPKDESRLRSWIQEISPLLEILKVTPNNLKENGRICARHFREKDFINSKRNSLVRNAKPSLSVSNLNVNYQNANEKNLMLDCHEKDIFQCGRCKTQFEQLSDFIDHKRFKCQPSNELKEKTESYVQINTPLIINNNEGVNNSFGQLFKVINQDDKLISVVMKENGFFVENPNGGLETQMILTPELCFNQIEPSIFVTNGHQVDLLSGNNKEILCESDGVVLSQVPGLVQSEVVNCDGSQNMVERTKVKLKTKLPCSYCGKLFEKPFNLQQHERVHTGERPFQCIICGRAFTQKSNVRKHMMRHRVWPKGKQTLKLKENNGEIFNEFDYSCQYCNSSFKSYAEHKKHLSVHSNFKVYRCIQKNCNETFGDLDEFLSHSKMHSSAEFQCHICLKSFTDLEELGVHQYDHDTTGREKQRETDIKLKCGICHARFKTAESLKNHLAVDGHNYACVHCQSVFSSERFLRRHLFIHVDPSRLKHECPNCQKSFRTLQNLKNHMYVHSEEKPFTCEHCEKQFASKYRLKRHVAVHLNEYFECPFKKHLGCDKSFYRKDKLRDHVNTHSHCKLRSCRMCPKTYWTLSKLNEHMRKEHKTTGRKGRPKEVLKCCRCSQTFRKEKQLTQHRCTVEEKKSKRSTKTKKTEAVSNIEIIMVPFGPGGENLT